MQDYMRAIGFSRMDKYELNNVLKSVIDEPKCEYITDGDDAVIAERSREFAERIGITVCGEYDKDGIFLKEYYFPYIRGEEVSVIEEISVEKLPDRTSYIGVSDDISRDISLAFYLLNRVDYIDNRQYAKRDRALKPIVLSALSISGRIIMPIYKNEAMMKKAVQSGASEITLLMRQGMAMRRPLKILLWKILIYLQQYQNGQRK